MIRLREVDGMKTKVLCLLLLLPAAAIAAQDRPDFSGTWIFNKERSAFEYRVLAHIERGTAVIEHLEPNFKFSRVYALGGQDDEASFEHSTDGREVEGQEGRWPAYYSMRWDGDVLVRTIRLQTSKGEAFNTFRFSLQEGGKRLQIDEQYKGPLQTFNNVWIFDLK
jgi:hypothetical protein